jgi:DnaJ like chaperone protein
MSNDEIKTQYRHLRTSVHPDRVASKGLPEPFITFAAEEFKRLGEVYETLIAARERGN